MSHETGRALDVLLAFALLAAAGVIVWRAAPKPSRCVVTAMRL